MDAAGSDGAPDDLLVAIELARVDEPVARSYRGGDDTWVVVGRPRPETERGHGESALPSTTRVRSERQCGRSRVSAYHSDTETTSPFSPQSGAIAGEAVPPAAPPPPPILPPRAIDDTALHVDSIVGKIRTCSASRAC